MKPELEIITKCPLCAAPELTPIFNCTDNLVSHEQFGLVDCNSCGLRLTSPRPSPINIGTYYQSEDYVSHSGTSRGFVHTLYHYVRSYTLYQKFQLIRHYHKNGNLLDYGAGSGEFLASMKRRGYSISGIEPDAQTRKRALEKNGIELFAPSSIDEASNDKTFNVITMWHVLEHVHDPKTLLIKLRNQLNKSGTLIIAVPNYYSKDATIYGSEWAAYDVPRHLFHFTQKTMTKLARLSGFEIQKVVPMYFDAYYVSMLSEKNKGGGIIRGVKSGLRSNLSARFKTGEYSSLIYVLQRIKP